MLRLIAMTSIAGSDLRTTRVALGKVPDQSSISAPLPVGATATIVGATAISPASTACCTKSGTVVLPTGPVGTYGGQIG
ncbi:MAG: hypothetical protein M3O92_02685 [Actinomycetota bacterium]|nr:hypothetical protein [Actinomycetota bacterium]